MVFLDWLKDLLVGLAWPAVIFFFVVFFRKELRDRISDLSEAGPTGFKFNPQKVNDPLPTPLPETVAYVHTVEKSLAEKTEALPFPDRIPTLLRELAASQTVARCELVFSSIFGSQVKGLDRLIQSGGSVSLEDAKTFFETEARSANPEFYSGVEFEIWAAFLTNSELVSIQNDRVSITDFGRAFAQFALSRPPKPY